MRTERGKEPQRLSAQRPDPDPAGSRKPEASAPKRFEVPLDRNAVTPLEEVERLYIEAVFEEFGGNKTRVAEALGIGRTTLYRKLGLRKD